MTYVTNSMSMSIAALIIMEPWLAERASDFRADAVSFQER